MPIREILTFPNPTLRKKSIPIDSVTDDLALLAQDMLETMYKARGIGLAAPQIGELIRLIVIDTRTPSTSTSTAANVTSKNQKASVSKTKHNDVGHDDGNDGYSDDGNDDDGSNDEGNGDDGSDDEGNGDHDSDRYTMTPLEEKIAQPLILINPMIVEQSGTTKMDEGCLSVPTYYETVTRSRHIQITALNEHGEKIDLETDGLLAICIQHEIDHLDGKLFIDRLSTLKSEKIKAKIKKYGYSTSSKESEDPPL